MKEKPKSSCLVYQAYFVGLIEIFLVILAAVKFSSHFLITYILFFTTPLPPPHYPAKAILTQLRSLVTVHSVDVVALFGSGVVVHEGQTVGTHLLCDHIVYAVVVLVTLAGVGEEAIGQRAIRDDLLLLGGGGCFGLGAPLTLSCGRTRALH